MLPLDAERLRIASTGDVTFTGNLVSTEPTKCTQAILATIYNLLPEASGVAACKFHRRKISHTR
jgi:hypothetical protein